MSDPTGSKSVVPVIAIDGPSASGKGTVAQRVAAQLGWHYLDSGALYRVVAHKATTAGIPLNADTLLANLARGMDLRFIGAQVWLDGTDVSEQIRTELAGAGASKVAALPAVRAALLDRQRDFRHGPGLVADGRDMGSVVFPDAAVKIYLTASAEARAERRYKQLIEKGNSANLPGLLQGLQERDRRDISRVAAPLTHTGDAHALDTTAMTVDEAVAAVVAYYRDAVQ